MAWRSDLISGLIVALVLAAIGFVLLLLPAYLDWQRAPMNARTGSPALSGRCTTSSLPDLEGAHRAHGSPDA